MYSRLIALPLLAGTLQASAAALSRRTPEPASFQSKSMRVAFTAVSDPYGFKNDDLQGDSNVAYIANITIAGQQFQVRWVCIVQWLVQNTHAFLDRCNSTLEVRTCGCPRRATSQVSMTPVSRILFHTGECK